MLSNTCRGRGLWRAIQPFIYLDCVNTRPWAKLWKRVTTPTSTSVVTLNLHGFHPKSIIQVINIVFIFYTSLFMLQHWNLYVYLYYKYSIWGSTVGKCLQHLPLICKTMYKKQACDSLTLLIFNTAVSKNTVLAPQLLI